ncbi:unnamed protein product, partial [Amoebophrya sp. A25]
GVVEDTSHRSQTPRSLAAQILMVAYPGYEELQLLHEECSIADLQQSSLLLDYSASNSSFLDLPPMYDGVRSLRSARSERNITFSEVVLGRERSLTHREEEERLVRGLHQENYIGGNVDVEEEDEQGYKNKGRDGGDEYQHDSRTSMKMMKNGYHHQDQRGGDLLHPSGAPAVEQRTSRDTYHSFGLRGSGNKVLGVLSRPSSVGSNSNSSARKEQTASSTASGTSSGTSPMYQHSSPGGLQHQHDNVDQQHLQQQQQQHRDRAAGGGADQRHDHREDRAVDQVHHRGDRAVDQQLLPRVDRVGGVSRGASSRVLFQPG